MFQLRQERTHITRSALFSNAEIKNTYHKISQTHKRTKEQRKGKSNNKNCIANIDVETTESKKIASFEDQVAKKGMDNRKMVDAPSRPNQSKNNNRYLGLKDVPLLSCGEVVGLGAIKILI